MPDTKLQPENILNNIGSSVLETMNVTKDKSSEQRFGHVNATNRNSV